METIAKIGITGLPGAGKTYAVRKVVEMLEAEGLRDKVILACGGPRISHELAKELGYDAGFGMNTYADDVASFIAQELDRRMNH